MTSPDDDRMGRLLVLLRRRLELRQADVAKAARVPRRDIQLIESGSGGVVALDRTRRVFEAAGGRARLGIWWNGAAADRLLDERHAALVERALGAFRRRGWLTAAEVSYSEFGERGSVDILTGHPPTRSIAVCEVKSDFGSLEETNRMLDVKERLAPKLALERFGWRPSAVGRVLIVPDESTLRRVVERHRETMRSIYPSRGREIRAWLRSPTGYLRGIWFLSEVRPPHPATARQSREGADASHGGE